VAHCLQAARHLVRAGAGFHAHQARRHLRHHLEQPRRAQMLAQHGLALRVDCVHAHDALRQIDADGRNLSHGCLS
jgi:hypothetical protein